MSNKRKLLILNGPRKCGKGKLLEHLSTQIQDWVIIPAQCKENLHLLTRTLLGLGHNTYSEIYYSHENKAKIQFVVDLTKDEYILLTYIVGHREVKINKNVYTTELCLTDVMIYVSECLVKPRFGEDYFGRTRVNTLITRSNRATMPVLATDDSGGFEKELLPLKELQELGWDILILQIRGRGTFKGDSRDYIYGDGSIPVAKIYNTTTEKEYLDSGLHLIHNWLNT